jgi:hypothetical protein
LREGQHFRADVHARNLPARLDQRGRSLRDTAGARTKVEDVLSDPRGRTRDNTFDDGLEAPIDLSQVDVGDAIPNSDLPRQTFSFLVGFDHDFSSQKGQPKRDASSWRSARPTL